MADRKLSSTIRGASAVNLRYSAELLNLARDYVRDFAGALTAAADDAGEDAPRRQPTLLLAGRAGETANAAFVLDGGGRLKGVVTLKVEGEFADSVVTVEPERLSFAEGGERVVRILARIGKEMPAETDFVGAVVIPEFDHRITSFVLRKLGD